MSFKAKWTRDKLRKKAERGFRGYPVATIGFYVPDNVRASKVAVGIVESEGAEPDPMQKWYSEAGDVRNDDSILESISAFLRKHAVKSVVAADRIIGSPHEGGIDRSGAQCASRFEARSSPRVLTREPHAVGCARARFNIRRFCRNAPFPSFLLATHWNLTVRTPAGGCSLDSGLSSGIPCSMQYAAIKQSTVLRTVIPRRRNTRKWSAAFRVYASIGAAIQCAAGDARNAGLSPSVKRQAHHTSMTFRVGDKVVKNPATWEPNAFDEWGRGEGVGVVVEPPFDLGGTGVDVLWLQGRCFEDIEGLLPAPSNEPDQG